MKILTLASSFPRYRGDFTGNFIYELVKGLKERGFEIIVLTTHHPDTKLKEEVDGLKIYRFPYFYPFKYQTLYRDAFGFVYNFKRSHLAKIQAPFFFLSELFSAIRIIRKEKIDMIHSHWLVPQGLIGAICKKIFGISHVTTVHGEDINTFKKLEILSGKKSKILSRIYSFVLHNSDRINANSSYTKSIVLSIDGRIKNKIEIIPMGVDINRFKHEDDTNIKEDFGAGYLILSVGRLIDLKGTKYLIIAMKDVIKKFPNSKLVVAGGGPEKKKLKKLTKDLNLEDNVIFIGSIKNSDLPKYYSSADVFVLPSINIQGQAETLGVVLLESMSCGTPVIGTNVGGITDIIKDGYNGFLVSDKSPEDLADKIIELLSNKELVEELSANGLKTIRERFSWEVVIEEFCNIYEQTLTKRR